MRLFIAEKPSVGRAIAAVLPGKAVPRGPEKSPPTHIEVGNDVVTWAFGHLLEQAQPEDYSESYKNWTFEALPIIPFQWKMKPRADAGHQLAAIKKLLASADEVVNGGDAGREGQLLIDEILEHFAYKKSVRRLWLKSMDEPSVRAALADLRDNSDYNNLRASAEARARGDWLVGMNLSRAYTLAGRQRGFDGVLSVGRVQTPTLALVVNRDLEIERFQPKDFYNVIAELDGASSTFSAKWKPGDRDILDEDGRLLNKQLAEACAAKIVGSRAEVTSYQAENKETPCPLPYSLSALQIAANKAFGFGAQEVLNIAQALYEAKITTYPRSDCQYLPVAQHADAARILAGLPQEYADLVKLADPGRKSSAWNDKKLEGHDHHGIIPTGQDASHLTGNEKAIFDLVARNYLAQFFAPYVYHATQIELAIADETFVCAGRIPVSSGWKQIYGSTADDASAEDAQPLPTLTVGQQLVCTVSQVESKKTTPPSRFTEGTLIAAMTNIHRLVDDPDLKKRLKETAGIGTEATRAGIIETLKKRGFLATKGKFIISTDTGRKLIASLPPAIKSPGLTALFEQALDGVAEGRTAQNAFEVKIIEFVMKYVEHAKQATIQVAPQLPCPVCKEGHLRRLSNDRGHFWGCSRYKEGCKTSYPDKAGKPDMTGKKKAPAKGRR